MVNVLSVLGVLKLLDVWCPTNSHNNTNDTRVVGFSSDVT